MPNKDKQLERAGKKGIMAGMILGTIRKGSSTGSRLARPLAYGAGGYLTGTALHLLADRAGLLQKKAEETSKATEAAKAAVGATVAYNAGRGAPSRILGYHKIYHGSSKENVDSIRKSGLDPKRGGIDGATDRALGHKPSLQKYYKENSTGQVHFTKQKRMADMFSGAIGSKRVGNDKIKDAMKAFLTGIHDGHTHSALMSDSHYRSAKVDMDASPFKNMAAKTHHAIKPEQIKGSESYKGIRGVVNKNTLRRYYAGAGKKRAGRGLALAGAALLASKYAYNHGKKALGMDKKAGALYDLYSKHDQDWGHHLNEYYKLFDKEDELTDAEWDTLRAHDDAADNAFWAREKVIEDMDTKGKQLGLIPFEKVNYGVDAAKNALIDAAERNKGFPLGGIGLGVAAAGTLVNRIPNNKTLALTTLGLAAAGGLLSKAYTMHDEHSATKALEHVTNSLNTYKSF